MYRSTLKVIGISRFAYSAYKGEAAGTGLFAAGS